jgi:ubiquinone/menaquinone biosynthesis C-methylase UbiE
LDFTANSHEEDDEIDKYNKEIFYETWKLAPEEYNVVSWDSEYEIYRNHEVRFKEKVILDAGCGSGRISEFLLTLSPKALVLVDIGDSIRIAQSRLSKKMYPFPILFIKSNLIKLPLQNESIDTVLCNGVLHHVSNQGKVLQELLRICGKNLILGIVSEKLFFGRMWISGNPIRRVTRKVYNRRISLLMAKMLAWPAFIAMLIISRIGSNMNLKGLANNALLDPHKVRKMQYLVLDFLTSPYYQKFPDQYYLDLAQQHGFSLNGQSFSNQEVFFHFSRRDCS